MAVVTIPKRWTLVPKTFGQAAMIEWRQPDPDASERARARQADHIAAARMQHDWAWQLNAYRRTRRLTLRDFAAIMDMTEERIGDLLRGDSPATLVDIAAGGRLLSADREPNGGVSAATGSLMRPPSAGDVVE